MLIIWLHFPILGGYSHLSFSIIKALVMYSRNRTKTLSSYIIEKLYVRVACCVKGVIKYIIYSEV